MSATFSAPNAATLLSLRHPLSNEMDTHGACPVMLVDSMGNAKDVGNQSLIRALRPLVQNGTKSVLCVRYALSIFILSSLRLFLCYFSHIARRLLFPTNHNQPADQDIHDRRVAMISRMVDSSRGKKTSVQSVWNARRSGLRPEVRKLSSGKSYFPGHLTFASSL